MDPPRDAFRLSKWYLDCVSPGGDVFIGYRARLFWRGAAFTYASTLVKPAAGEVRTRASLSRVAGPSETGPDIRWVHGPLGVEGVWRSRGPSCEERVFTSASGEVTWHGLQPRSFVSVAAQGTILEGWGYAERLEMTARPWRLPLDVLRWGRFVGESGSVAWIDWRGEESRTFVFDGGRPVEGATAGDDGIGLPGGRLTLETEGRVVLRDGSLGTAALHEVPRLARLLPARVLGLRETKWLSRAVLARNGVPVEAGRAIHEVVRFSRAGGRR